MRRLLCILEGCSPLAWPRTSFRYLVRRTRTCREQCCKARHNNCWRCCSNCNHITQHQRSKCCATSCQPNLEEPRLFRWTNQRSKSHQQLFPTCCLLEFQSFRMRCRTYTCTYLFVNLLGFYNFFHQIRFQSLRVWALCRCSVSSTKSL